MTGESIGALVNAGAAGAVIAVVVIFLRFIKERDEVAKVRDQQWRDFFTAIRQTDADVIAKLTTAVDRVVDRLDALEGKFDAHDATEMEFLRSVVANQGKAQPRKQS